MKKLVSKNKFKSKCEFLNSKGDIEFGIYSNSTIHFKNKKGFKLCVLDSNSIKYSYVARFGNTYYLSFKEKISKNNKGIFTINTTQSAFFKENWHRISKLKLKKGEQVRIPILVDKAEVVG